MSEDLHLQELTMPMSATANSPLHATPKKKLSIDKIIAMTREIALLDRRIAHVKRQMESGVSEASVSMDVRSDTPTSSSIAHSTGSSFPSDIPPSPKRPSLALGVVPTSCENLEDDSAVNAHVAVEMCHLAATGDLAGLRALLATGVDPNCVDYDHRTPLHIAAERGNLEIVRLLLQSNANSALVDEDGKTPAVLATERGHDAVRDALMFVNVASPLEPDSFLYSASMASSESPQPPNDLVVDVPTIREDTMVVIMVGLPGRGKTYIAQHIQRYFLWNHYKCGLFTHQSYRKRATGTVASFPSHIPDAEARTSTLLASEINDFFGLGGNVAIVDGTHSTSSRRQTLRNCLMETTQLPSTRIIFVEIYSNDRELIMSNIHKAQEASKNVSPTFVDDYLANMRQHEQVYRTLSQFTDSELSFIRIDHQVTYNLNRIDGWLQSRLAYMLHNLRHTPQTFYLTRSGEYEDLVSGRIGGNSRLTKRGEAYSRALYEFMKTEMANKSFVVMSSCAMRCTQTVKRFVNAALKNSLPMQEPPAPAHLPPPPPQPKLSQESMSSSFGDNPLNATTGSNVSKNSSFPKDASSESLSSANTFSEANCRVAYFPTLDDLNHGDCEGQLISEIKETLPNTMALMQADRFTVAWPNGESLQQLLTGRLEPHIHEIQASTQPLLVVTHEPLIQGLYAYFVRDDEGRMIPPEEAHLIKIPQHTVIRVVQRVNHRVAELIDLEPRVQEILQQHPIHISKKDRKNSVSEEAVPWPNPSAGNSPTQPKASDDTPTKVNATLAVADFRRFHRGSDVLGE